LLFFLALQQAVKQRSAQDILNDLDERYMQESFDPVKELFGNLPEGEEVSAGDSKFP
jgi:hypothetical protein